MAETKVILSHEEALNLLLANCCPKDATRNSEDIYTYEVELHCRIARVTAKLVSTVNTVQFEILSVEVE